MKLSRRAARALRLAPVDWAAFAARLTSQELDGLSRELDGAAEYAARAARYLAYRGGFGCGDQGHTRAVKASNAAVRKVRKALGYSYTTDLHFGEVREVYGIRREETETRVTTE